MKRFLFASIALLAFGLGARAQTPAGTPATITQLLNHFLTHVDDPAEHQRFWADDLIYMSSRGTVLTKAAILKDMAEHPEPAAGPHDRYAAEDVVVRPYGADVAVLTFRLVRRMPGGAQSYFRNSGVFVRRAGQWQVVNWQATASSAGGVR